MPHAGFEEWWTSSGRVCVGKDLLVAGTGLWGTGQEKEEGPGSRCVLWTLCAHGVLSVIFDFFPTGNAYHNLVCFVGVAIGIEVENVHICDSWLTEPLKDRLVSNPRLLLERWEGVCLTALRTGKRRPPHRSRGWKRSPPWTDAALHRFPSPPCFPLRNTLHASALT